MGALIRDARRRAGLTQDALAERIGCSKSQLSLMETGKRSVSPARARNLEDALDLHDGRLVAAVAWDQTPGEVKARVSASQRFAERLRDAARRGERLEDLLETGELARLVEGAVGNVADIRPVGRPIPVINAVAAGYPREFTDLDFPASVADDYVACPDVTDPHAFAARVVGDSMEPDYREGDIVVFSPALATPSGADCFVRLERDAETTFKRIFYEPTDARTIRLQPLNNRYPPRECDRQDIAGIYAAAYVMRRIGR
ncbi:MAG: helix-turn-helix domain-containing protein [Phycisphaerales bacterium]|nr:helix-turn-helix domain-containing protein [Phycisphaerales bacterium]